MLVIDEADTNGRIVFTPSKGLPGVGLPRKAVKGDTSFTLTTPDGTKEGIALGWEDVRDLREGTITRRVTDATHTDGPVERHLVYDAPFDSPQREQDYVASSRETVRTLAVPDEEA